MKCFGHRRRGLYRLESGRRAARARRRGDGGRQPLDRAPRQPRRRAGGGRRAGRARHPRRRRAERRWPPTSGPRRSSTWPPRSTSASRSRTPPSTPRSTSAAPPTCSRRRARRRLRPRRLRLHRRARSTARARASELPLDEATPIAPLSAYGQSKFAAEGYLGPLSSACTASPASRCGSATSTARARIRSARPAWSRSSAACCARAAARPSSATAPRPATTYMWATWSTAALAAAASRLDRRGQHRHRPRGQRARPGRDRCGGLGGVESFEPEFAPPRAGEVQRISIDAARAERELDWRPRPASRTACASPSTRSSGAARTARSSH